MFQLLCTGSSGRKKEKWRKSHIKCRCRDKEVPDQYSHGYQIMDRSPQTVTKYLIDEKTHTAINSKLFENLDNKNNSLYEFELAKAQVEHKEPIIVEFFILQYAKLRMLELYYKFLTKFCDVNKFEELEMDTHLLYRALAEIELECCIKQEIRAERQRLLSNDFADSFTADAVANCFRRRSCVKHKQHDKRVPGFFKEEFRCTDMLCLRIKTYCCYEVTSNNLKFIIKGLNKRGTERRQSTGKISLSFERKRERHFEQ